MIEKKILIVDDEQFIRLTLSRSLEPLGFPVFTAVNGEEALRIMEQENASVVLLDLKMPGMGGMKTLLSIKQKWPASRVIIITAHGAVETAVEAMKNGASEFIQKPFSPAEIREAVLKIMEHDPMELEKCKQYRRLLTLSRRYIKSGHYKEAEEATLRALAAQPARPEAFNLFGILSERTLKLDEARNFYRAALDIDSRYIPAAVNYERIRDHNPSSDEDFGENFDW